MSSPKPIEKLIVNSPFKEPFKYWKFDKTIKEFILKEGRRPAVILLPVPGTGPMMSMD